MTKKLFQKYNKFYVYFNFYENKLPVFNLIKSNLNVPLEKQSQVITIIKDY